MLRLALLLFIARTALASEGMVAMMGRASKEEWNPLKTEFVITVAGRVYCGSPEHPIKNVDVSIYEKDYDLGVNNADDFKRTVTTDQHGYFMSTELFEDLLDETCHKAVEPYAFISSNDLCKQAHICNKGTLYSRIADARSDAPIFDLDIDICRTDKTTNLNPSIR